MYNIGSIKSFVAFKAISIVFLWVFFSYHVNNEKSEDIYQK